MRWCLKLLKTCFSVLYQHLLFILFLLLRQCLLLFHSPVELPDAQGSVSHHTDLFFPISYDEDPYYGPLLPVSAIAGLEGDEAETFMVIIGFFFIFYYFKSLHFFMQIGVNNLMFVKQVQPSK